MLLELDGTGPLYLQLARALKRVPRAHPERDELPLPSTRDLAAELRIGRNSSKRPMNSWCPKAPRWRGPAPEPGW